MLTVRVQSTRSSRGERGLQGFGERYLFSFTNFLKRLQDLGVRGVFEQSLIDF